MKTRIETINLLNQLKILKAELSSLVYGSVEIRERSGKKYIYVHYRDEGISLTKHVGEFSDELYNLIIKNSIKAKELKKQIKSIEKELKVLGYSSFELSNEVKNNIDLARKQLAQTIYDQAVLEGVATTYIETETIIEGGRVNNMTASDIMKVVNLKHAWEFILNEGVISSPTDFGLLTEINKLIIEGFYYNAGVVRSTPVKIGGTNFVPSIPVESVVKEELIEILNSNENALNVAINLLLYVMKKQIFIDGNKRTAVVFANHYLISNGKGLIVIPNDKVKEYKKLLVEYYETNNDKNIKEFLKENCYIKN